MYSGRVNARVDTSQSMISVTPMEFEELVKHLKPLVDTTCENDICTSTRECAHVQNYLETFSIQLDQISYTIPRSGLTIDTADGCLIGITSSENIKEIVLGTLFLKNYGTTLDFDKNRVSFALTGPATAIHKKNYMIVGLSLLGVAVIVFIVAISCWACKRKVSEDEDDAGYSA